MTEALTIPLRNRGGWRLTIVDASDAPLLVRANYRWYFDGRYAATHTDGGRVRLHRFLCALDRSGPLEVDHINGDCLDNRRVNLRVVSHLVNGQNRHGGRGTSLHRGVSWNDRRGTWVAQAQRAGTHHFLGYFDDEDQAATVVRQFWAAS
jgi:HNH endonuclease